jgi:site-specific recombinase XerD
VSPFTVRRADIESFARELEARGRARATVTRRLCTIAEIYKYAVEENSWTTCPRRRSAVPGWTANRTRPRWDRNELGALLVAGLGPPAEHALISLLALNGLRVSEATGADIERLGLERGHRTLVIIRKGGKVGHHPARPTHRPGDRPGDRQAHRRTSPRHNGREADGPAL